MQKKWLQICFKQLKTPLVLLSSCNTVVPELYVGSVKQAAVLLVMCRSAGRSDPCTPDSGIWGFHGPKILAGRRQSPESPLSQIWLNIQLRPSHLSIREEQMWSWNQFMSQYTVCVCVYIKLSELASQNPQPSKRIQIEFMQGFNLTIFHGNVAKSNSIIHHWKMSWSCFTSWLVVCCAV